ncbi:hypothetical protein EVA_14458 [gut metagenome]|uniref:Uncharacterized protein n=1 Tax=gut metagenome TaxID=749906 RepID=J9GDI1_9ZZZZ
MNVQLSSEPVSFEHLGSRIAVDTIYSYKYLDSYNKVGASNSYMHRAHPTKLEYEMRINLSDSNPAGIYPVKITYGPVYHTFYHREEDKMYEVEHSYSMVERYITSVGKKNK